MSFKEVLLIGAAAIVLISVLKRAIAVFQVNRLVNSAGQRIANECRQKGLDIRACDHIEITDFAVDVRFPGSAQYANCKTYVENDSPGCWKKKLFARKLRERFGLSGFTLFSADEFYRVPNAVNYEVSSNGPNSVTVTQRPKVDSYKKVFLCSRASRQRQRSM